MNENNELMYWKDKIHEIGMNHGLDFYEMVYEIVPDDVMYTFGSYGMPNRFNHWRFGKQFFKMQKMRKMGLMKIYELVINTDPCYAFLLDSNTLLENKLIIAHVLGHSDFFKNNRKFMGTNKNMLEEMVIHSEKIKQYEQMHGVEEVEKIIDLAMTIEEQTQLLETVKKSPILDDWQIHIIEMIAQEAAYFSPQGETKIINEGWATYWHVKIMREILEDEKEIVDFAKMHGGVVRPNPKGINPYLLGYRMFLDIEKKWGKEKMFEVRELDSDMTFIRKYFTQEIAEDLNMYVYKPKGRDANEITDTSFEEVKNKMVHSMVNKGFPYVVASYEEDEFAIHHEYDGRKVDFESLKHVISTIQPYIGKEIVSFYTIKGDKKIKLEFEKEEMRILYV